VSSEDGFELTFAVNHLAHYLLVRLLAPTLASGARIIFTASGTHDPEEKTGMPAPRHAEAARLAHPSRDPQLDESPMSAGRRAYSTSKLCNIMTVRELARRIEATRPDLAVIAYDPGFTPGTGLARNYPGIAGAIFKYVMPWTTRRSASVSTPANSGRLLAELISAPHYARSRGQYFVMQGASLQPRDPSMLARDAVAGAKLWDDSAGLVGLSTTL
jgi:NAD(P)-dependent dehydrogenase (short-subunit alcohol dehydrogenase family)